jgi:hypothetical protein
MWLAFKRHYPFVALTLVAVPLLLGDPALLILGLALAIVLIPCAYATDVDEIAERTRRPRRTRPPPA